MKKSFRFIKRVFFRFINVVTGTVVALYYIYVAPLISGQSYKPSIDIFVPMLALFIAFFLAWKDSEDEKQQLLKKISELEDKKPKYVFEFVDESNVLVALIKEVDGSIKDAKKKEEQAPRPHPLLGSLAFMGEPTPGSWASYIKELEEYKTYMQEVLDDKEIKVKNILITNKGATDTDIHVAFDFKNMKQAPDFYSDHIELKKPHEPSSYLRSAIPAFNTTIQKLGIRREVHNSTETSMGIEIEKLRSGDYVYAYHDPMFIVYAEGKKEITYELNSSLCKPMSGNVLIKKKD